MPTTTNGDVTLYYGTDGSGETVTFVGDVGFGSWQWAWQYDGLAGPYETLVWDLRGTGRSDSPSGPYDVDTLASDLEAVLAANAVRRTHLVGAGLGGMVALRYAREYTRAGTLTLFGPAPRGSAVHSDAARALHPEERTATALERSLTGAFSEAFLESNDSILSQIETWRREADADPDGVLAQLAAMTSFEAGPLYELTLPALVCHGLEDPVVDVDVGRSVARDLPKGQFEAIEGKRLCFVEHARAVTDRLDGFFLDNGFPD